VEQIGIFLWDHAEGMQMLRDFWDAAVELDHDAIEVDEGIRFPLCREAGFKQVEGTAIEVRTFFQNFEDHWQPFLGGVGPASSHATRLDPKDRQELGDLLSQSLPIDEAGSISLIARAWAVKGTA
jgi:hypothetical protein